MRSDAELQRAVLEELRWDPSVDAANIGVAVKDGVVVLTGTVPNWSQRYAAERAAKRVRGVKAIANDIEVRLPGTDEMDDAEIAKRVRDALEWRHAEEDADNIRVEVDGSKVTLRGRVHSWTEREAAEEAAWAAPGVTYVDNQIEVVP